MKTSKADVHYSLGMLHSHCGPTFRDDRYFCRHFIPQKGYVGRCELVEGDIEPTHWCERFEKTKAT